MMITTSNDDNVNYMFPFGQDENMSFYKYEDSMTEISESLKLLAP